MFEIKARSAAGRIGSWQIGKHKITTPTIAIVVSPNTSAVPVSEIKKAGAELIITNAYIMKRSEHCEKIERQGVHAFYGWNGPIYTDSGTFQMYSQKKAEITPLETLEFQKKIGSDIITPLDLFTLPADSRPEAKKKLSETLQRIKEARRIVDAEAGTGAGRLLCGPVQGGKYLDLRKKAASEVSEIRPDVFAIGGIVPLMEQYRFSELMDVILSARTAIDPSKPLHAFGCGHPMLFSLLVSIGVDVFDSAAYAIFAKQGRYLTSAGTKIAHELRELPCSCPICSSHTAREIASDVHLLAMHNLHATFGEIRAIREAIYEGMLWEFTEQRIRAHPALLEAYLRIKKYAEFLETQEPVSSKHALFYLGSETAIRPTFIRIKEKLRGLAGAGRAKNGANKGKKGKNNGEKNDFRWLSFKVPSGIKAVYPFGQSVLPSGKKSKAPPVEPIECARASIAYQYCIEMRQAKKVFPTGCEIEVSKNTGRIRRIFEKSPKGGSAHAGQNLILGTFRDSDGYFVPSIEGAKRILKLKKGEYSVAVCQEAEKYILEGKNVFSKFVVKAGDKIRPGDEVFITGKSGDLIATGTALLNAKEMLSFKYGAAVETRRAA